MPYVDFLNIEYFLTRTYQLFWGVDIDVYAAGALSTAQLVVTGAVVLGLFVAFVLFVLFIWVRIKHAAVEHELEERRRPPAPEEIQEVVRDVTRWEVIMTLASSANDSERRRAIMEADNMLGDVLAERGYLGEGVGEMLRNANPLQFSTLDLAWRAHKIRNDIAHGRGTALTERDIQAAIDHYRHVFEEFGVI